MKSCPYARALLFSRALVIGIVLGFFAFRACSVDPVEAQAPRAQLSDEAALARVCLSEDGWEGDPQECAAHSAAAANRGIVKGLSWRVALEAYSRRTFDSQREGRRAWLSRLTADAVQPRAWPSRYDWPGRYRGLWLQKVETARRVIEGSIVPDCEHPPEHWGGMRIDSDRERAERMVASGRWFPSNCYRPSSDGDRIPTANTFFSVRRRAAR